MATKLPSGSLRVTRPWKKNKALPRAMRSPVPLDRRSSWIGREVYRFRKALVEQLGGPEGLTMTQLGTLELACQIKARLLTLDRAFADDSRPEMQTYTGVRSYLSLVHGLTRQLKELGLTAQVLLKQKHATSPGLQDRLKLLEGGKKAANE